MYEFNIQCKYIIIMNLWLFDYYVEIFSLNIIFFTIIYQCVSLHSNYMNKIRPIRWHKTDATNLLLLINAPVQIKHVLWYISAFTIALSSNHHPVVQPVLHDFTTILGLQIARLPIHRSLRIGAQVLTKEHWSRTLETIYEGSYRTLVTWSKARSIV